MPAVARRAREPVAESRLVVGNEHLLPLVTHVQEVAHPGRVERLRPLQLTLRADLRARNRSAKRAAAPAGALLNTKLHELERAKPARRALAKPKRRARR